MTNEKLEEEMEQHSEGIDTTVLTERQVRPCSGPKPSARKKTLFDVSVAMLSCVLGFLLGGTEFPLQTYPLGCALVASLPRYVVSATLGITARLVYLFIRGSDLLLPMICCVSILICRLILNIVLFGRKKLLHLKRFPDPVSMKMLLCAVFVFGTSFVDALYIGITPYSILRAILTSIVSVTFTLLFTFFFDEEYCHHPVFEAGFGALCFTLSLSLSPFSIGMFSLGLAVALPREGST